MTDRNWMPRSQRVQRLLEEEVAKHLPPAPAPQADSGPRALGPAQSPEPSSAKPEAPGEAKASHEPEPAAKVSAPAKPNIDLDVFRAETALLAQTDPEILLKGLMLECRELVRGTANVISNPEFYRLHDDYFHTLKGAAEMSARLAEAIVKLRQGGGVEERCQRIIVERIERAGLSALPLPEGGGGRGILKNE